MLQEGEVFTGSVSALAFGGEGIIRHDGFVVFVPFVAPGDIVKVRVTKTQKRHAFGTLIEVVTPSEKRIAARCPHFGVCGGCQLQHLPYDAQLDYKRQSVGDALQRLGGRPLNAPVTIAAAQEQWAYRRHVKLHLKPEGKGYSAGYVRADLNGIVTIRCCPIFVEETNPVIAQLQQFAAALSSEPDNPGTVAVIKASAGRFVFVFRFDKAVPPGALTLLKAQLTKSPEWQGALLEGGKESHSCGDLSCSLEIEGMQITFSPGAFVQCHPEQSLRLYQDLVSWAEKLGAKRCLDLYSGIGITSLLLARKGVAVVGVEGNPTAVDLAERNAQQHQVEATFVRADVARVTEALLPKHKPDLVIVNPPRTGLDPHMRMILKRARPRHLCYISCMPSTLARDIQELTTSADDILACQAYDMFPQTAHVETLVVISRV